MKPETIIRSSNQIVYQHMQVTSRDRAIRNALIAVLQVLISGATLFLLYRYLLQTIGSERMGVWSILLAGASVARISEMGFSASAVKYTARYIARNEVGRAAEVIQTTAITIGIVLAGVLTGCYLLIAWLVERIVPTTYVLEAHTILPYALVSVWIGAIASVFLAGLDGCQRIDMRAAVSLLGSVFLLPLTWTLVPEYGLYGLIWAQLGQGLIMLFGGWFFLRRELSSLPLLFLKWDYSLFREMFKYGVNFQITSVFMLLFDPTTKALLVKFGGLSSAAYYEMASRMVVQLRSLLVSANQVLVPQIAELHENAPGEIRKVYLTSYRVIFFLSLPLYVGLACAAPLASEIWIGHYEQNFVTYAVLLSAGLFINNLVAPAYFANLGTGMLNWNTLAHVMLGLLNLILGSLLGIALGGDGVVLGYVTALIIGSALVIFGYHRENKIQFTELFPIESRKLCFICCIGLLAAWGISFPLQVFNKPSINFGLALAACAIPIGIAVWMHPLRSSIFSKIMGLFRWRNPEVV